MGMVYRDATPISIHAPRVGSDSMRMQENGTQKTISIHAPRVGSDLPGVVIIEGAFDFNPRSPCGERPSGQRTNRRNGLFQSTLPVWGATAQSRKYRDNNRISIHAPRVGSDADLEAAYDSGHDFNPRSPCGERPPVHLECFADFYFNPRSPCGERRQLWN